MTMLMNERIIWKKGLKEGLLEGRREGERREKFSTAKKLLSLGFNFSDILNITGLSPDELNSIV